MGRWIGDAFSIGNCYGTGLAGRLKHYARSGGKNWILKAYSTYLSLKNRKSRTEDEIKTEMPARSLIYPLPTILLGANIDDKPNYSVVANCGIISENPPVLCVSSMKHHHTNTDIRNHGSFTLNIPNVSLVRKTDYCGIVSGKNIDKSEVFKTFFRKTTNAPMIEECPVNIDCKLLRTYPFKHMEVFIGEATEAFFSESCIVGNRADIKKINPIIYALNRKYWSVGEKI